MAVLTVQRGQNAIAVQSERIARMIAFLVERQHELAAIDKGQVAFHFAGRTGLTVETVSKNDLSQS